MGHYLSELYPRGMDVEIREEQEREWQRKKAKKERFLSRLKQEGEWMKISGLELSQNVLKRRMKKMFARFENISSVIPVPIVLKIPDGEDVWEISGSWDKKGKGKLYFLRPRFGEDEHFDLSIDEEEARIVHREKGLEEISHNRNSSERELQPAEELFDRLISPIEEKMGLKPLGENGEQVVFQNKP